MSPEIRKVIRRDVEEMFEGRFEVAILGPGMKLANQQEWKPERIDIECGSLEIRSISHTQTSVLIDGQEIKCRSFVLSGGVDQITTVKLELMPTLGPKVDQPLSTPTN